MSFHKLLIPTDFSPSSEAAVQVATTLAKNSGAALLIVHVDEATLPYGFGVETGAAPGAERPSDRKLRELLESVVPSDESVPFEHRLLSGDPASEILRLADEEHVDLIVLATHGRTGLHRLLMGSVAELVVRRAGCPVLTLKQPLPAGDLFAARRAGTAKETAHK